MAGTVAGTTGAGSYYASPFQIKKENHMADKKTAPKAATKKTLKGGKKIGNTKLMGVGGIGHP
jgi:hypothetical protein